MKSSLAESAKAWRDDTHATICDRLEPWEHGVVARATRYQNYYDFNVVRIEDDPGMTVAELVAFADEALAGLAHRRVDFDDAAVAARLRPGFEAAGWRSMRLLWMHHDGPRHVADTSLVREVPYDAVADLRLAWHHEDFPDSDPGAYHEQSREVAMRRNVKVLAAHDHGFPIGYAQVERQNGAAEVAQVYVRADHRGRGLGTAITRAAIASAGDATDLWICADDEDRPKELYARLGFRAAWVTVQFTRLPT